MLRPGDAAPDFVLSDANGEDVRLSSFSNQPIILYFYVRDGAPTCTIQAKRMRDQHAEFASRNAVVVGVSLDGPESHADFAKELDLPYMLLSDEDGHAHDLYDAWRTSLFGRTSLAVRRSSFLIDEDGIIREVYRHVNVLRHAHQILKDLDRIKAQNSWGKEAST